MIAGGLLFASFAVLLSGFLNDKSNTPGEPKVSPLRTIWMKGFAGLFISMSLLLIVRNFVMASTMPMYRGEDPPPVIVSEKSWSTPWGEIESISYVPWYEFYGGVIGLLAPVALLVFVIGAILISRPFRKPSFRTIKPRLFSVCFVAYCVVFLTTDALYQIVVLGEYSEIVWPVN